MVKIFILFLIIIIGIAILVGAAVALRSRNNPTDIDRQYFDEEGNHLYYDRSTIEKSEFAKQHPQEGPLRTFRRLFSRKR